MYAPSFLLRTGLSHLHFFTSARSPSQGTAVDGDVHCTSNQVGQRFCDTVFPSCEGQLLISPHPHVVVAILIFKTRATLQRYFYYDFLICECHTYILLVV
jgi:hypothetical protein